MKTMPTGLIRRLLSRSALFTYLMSRELQFVEGYLKRRLIK